MIRPLLLLTSLLFSSLQLSGADAAGTLAERIAGAAPGARLEVPAGVHQGPFLIDKPLTLIGEPGAELVGDGQSHVVQITAPDVELAGFMIRRSGSQLERDHAGVHVSAARAVIRDNTVVDCLHGIYVRAADDAVILNNTIRGRAVSETIADPVIAGVRLSPAELCAEPLEQNQRGNGIHLWKSSGHRIEGNDIRRTRDGIYFSFTDGTVVRGNHVSQVRYGLHYMYSDNNTFEANHFTDNAAGSALMFSRGLVLRDNRFVGNRSHRAYGLLLHSVDETVIQNNWIVGNTIGMYLENNNGNELAGNRVSSNYVGLRISDSSSGNAFSGNQFSRNLHPVETSGANLANQWSSAERGNWWDDAFALDLNDDGIVDFAHREVDLFGPWRRDFPAIALVSGSPGERLMRFIYSRTQGHGLPGITDPNPLVRPAAP